MSQFEVDLLYAKRELASIRIAMNLEPDAEATDVMAWIESSREYNLGHVQLKPQLETAMWTAYQLCGLACDLAGVSAEAVRSTAASRRPRSHD